MSNQLPTEFEAILAAIAGGPEGRSINEIQKALISRTPPMTLARRTLHRRLTTMVDERLIEISGEGRGTRYRLPQKPELPSLPEPETLPEFSTEGEALRDLIKTPLSERSPVEYNRDFLDAYEPNRTYYLDEPLRRKLAEAGQTPANDLEAGTYVRQIYNRLLIDLSWNSSRLEGNTYSLLETERLLELGESAEGKTARDAQMILNHKDAIEMLVDQASTINFDRYTILNLHALLADNLLADPSAIGRLRSIPVGVGGTVFRPLNVPQLIQECFEEILVKATAIADPFEQAFFAMVHFPYLQPFEDVNKRVSRLAANIPLIRRNLCPLSFVDLPGRDYIDGILCVYELNRTELLRDVFVRAYLRSCGRYATVRQELGEPDVFRLRYRSLISEVVGEVVKQAMDKKQATDYVQKRALGIPAEDQHRLIEVTETQLQSLHEGNFARYRVRPSEFEVWQANWR